MLDNHCRLCINRKNAPKWCINSGCIIIENTGFGVGYHNRQTLVINKNKPGFTEACGQMKVKRN